MSENTNTATVALASAATAKKDKSTIFRSALEAFKFTSDDTANTVTLAMSQPLTLHVHSDKNGFYCDFNNAGDLAVSANESVQEKRLQAVKYAFRNALYQTATRDLADARATSTTLKTQNAELASQASLANAQNAVLMFAMSVPNATLTQEQYNTATSAETFVAMLSQLEAKNRNRLRAFAKVATDAAVLALAQANARAADAQAESDAADEHDSQ